jgi:hypothetical protein
MKNIIFTIVFIFGLSCLTFAQFGSVGIVDAKSMSLGKTYNANTDGIYSIGINPANMMFSPSAHFEFSTVLPLPALSMKVGTNFMSFEDFKYFFEGGPNDNPQMGETTGRLLTTADKQRLFGLFSNSGRVFANVSVAPFAAMLKVGPYTGAFAFTMSDFIGGSFTVPKALVDLGLNGNTPNQVYSFNDVDAQSWWIREYSLSYARELPEIEQTLFDKISVGLSIKMVQGFAYFGVDHVNTNFSTGTGNKLTLNSEWMIKSAFSSDFGKIYDFDTTNTSTSKVGPFLTPAGTGLGIDFGVAAAYDKVWRFSLSVTDIGKINWNQNTAEYSGNGSVTLTDLTDSTQRQSISDTLKGKGHPTSGFTTDLPTAFRLGASYNLIGVIPGTLLVALDYNQGFNNVPGNSKIARWSLGADWAPLGWLNIRTGFSVGGVDGFGWALGLGLDTGTLEFFFATSDMNQVVVGNSAKMFTVSIGSRWKF